MLVITDYWAPWCGPCKVMMPALSELSDKFNVPNSGVEIRKVNVDEELETASKLRIKSIPTLIFVKDGQEVRRVTGLRTKAQVIDEIETILNS